MKVKVFFDGGKRGPDKPAASACVVLDVDGETLAHDAALLSVEATMNDAEYHGLLLGLRAAQKIGATEIEVYGDSNLVIQQVWGDFSHQAKFEPVHKEVRKLLAWFRHHKGAHVRREFNSAADRLVNSILDGAYRPFGSEDAAAPTDLAKTLSYVVTLQVPKSRVADAAGARKIRTDLASAIGKAFPVASVTVTKL